MKRELKILAFTARGNPIHEGDAMVLRDDSCAHLGLVLPMEVNGKCEGCGDRLLQGEWCVEIQCECRKLQVACLACAETPGEYAERMMP